MSPAAAGVVTFRQGWMSKRGPTAEYKWAPRWCVLTGDALLYFADEKCTLPKGRISIGEASKVIAFHAQAPGDAARHFGERPFGFVLNPDPGRLPRRRLFYFDAGNSITLRGWMADIQRAAAAQAKLDACGLAGEGDKRGPRRGSGVWVRTSSRASWSGGTVQEVLPQGLLRVLTANGSELELPAEEVQVQGVRYSRAETGGDGGVLVPGERVLLPSPEGGGSGPHVEGTVVEVLHRNHVRVSTANGNVIDISAEDAYVLDHEDAFS